MRMFHVERNNILGRVSTIFLIIIMFASCITPRHTIQINDYILVPNGKPVLGNTGLTAFIFENNQRQIPFVQFVADKYNVGTYNEVEYWVEVEGHRFKVLVYENSEVEKYFDTSDYMVSNVEPESNIVGSKANFIALSIINEINEDCLAEDSLYKNIAAKYLKNLKDEYNSL